MLKNSIEDNPHSGWTTRCKSEGTWVQSEAVTTASFTPPSALFHSPNARLHRPCASAALAVGNVRDLLFTTAGVDTDSNRRRSATLVAVGIQFPSHRSQGWRRRPLVDRCAFGQPPRTPVNADQPSAQWSPLSC